MITRINEMLKGNNRKIALALFDIFCFVVIDLGYYIMASLVDHSVPVDDPKRFILNSVMLLVWMFFFRFLFKIYRTVWRYTSTKAYFSLILADALGGISALLLTYIAGTYRGAWHFVVVASLTALLALMARFTYRLIYKKQKGAGANKIRKKTAIIGAGQLGVFLANDLKDNPQSDFDPLFFVDVNNTKVGKSVAGLPVYSELEADAYIDKYSVTNVIVAITTLTSERAAELYDYYTGLGCDVKIYDSLSDGAAKKDGKEKRTVRDFEIEDLLFRKQISINDKNSLCYYKDKTVLVTGGGGSIGSEICRQIAKCNPKKLIVLDIYENNAYDIQQELIRTYKGELDLEVEIASVRDKKRLDNIFRTYKPEIVFHAAAHKHVPLMEHSGFEAIKNNVLGTYNTANMAEKYKAEKFILISTDKAVNPTNVMGATKRMCEMIVQCRADSETSFAAVRFGNVLGSNGSVIPLFKKQIAEGGPVTITDKRIIRYFMTISEASQLVIEAGAMANRGELFVLDMGKPIKIYDLAVNMIRLSGLEPEKDIKIEEIGLRPGEKLYEELLMKSETLDKTPNDMIFIEKDSVPARETVDENIAFLEKAVADWEENGKIGAREVLFKVIPTFKAPHEVNLTAEDSVEMTAANV